MGKTNRPKSRASKTGGVSPATLAKQERQRFLAGLYRKGVPVGEIYRVMTGKFSVTPQTVRKDIRELGVSARKYMENEEALEAEVGAAIDRLKMRAQRDDSTGNKADELLLNLFGMRSTRELQKNLMAQALRLREAQADLATARAELEGLRLAQESDRVATYQNQDRRLEELTAGLAKSGTVTFQELVKMVTQLLRRQLADPAGELVHVMQSLRMLRDLALADPAARGVEDQLFKVPDGLLLELPIAPDDGDELVDSA